MENEILQEKENNEISKWTDKKRKSICLANSFNRIGQQKKAIRVWYCGNELEFVYNQETGIKSLSYANFCKERLCPMCQSRKGLKVFYQVSQIMDKIECEHDNLVPLFLTLTLENCNDKYFSKTLDIIFDGWNRMMKRRNVKRIIKGFFRVLEVTYNKRKDTYHPHVHAIILVDKKYFKSNDYMTTIQWSLLWRESLKISYCPCCDIRKIKRVKGQYKDVAEVAKYTMKDTDYIIDDEDKMDKIVDLLTSTLKYRRLYSFGGLFATVRKQLNLDNIDGGDLVNIENTLIRKDIAIIIERYYWNYSIANYIKQ